MSSLNHELTCSVVLFIVPFWFALSFLLWLRMMDNNLSTMVPRDRGPE